MLLVYLHLHGDGLFYVVMLPSAVACGGLLGALIHKRQQAGGHRVYTTNRLHPIKSFLSARISPQAFIKWMQDGNGS